MSLYVVGDDGADIAFTTPSMTDSRTTYEIHLERSTGNLYCDCPSATFGKKIGSLLNPEAGCKHAREFHKRLTQELS